jgi:hypothetical protein
MRLAGKNKQSEKHLSQCYLSTTNPTRTAVVSKPDARIEAAKDPSRPWRGFIYEVPLYMDFN